jgi:protein-disulfide isomerase
MSEDNSQHQLDENKITLKKSTYKKLLGGLVVLLAIAAFSSGYSVGIGSNDNSDSITKEDLNEILADIQKDQPVPTQVPTQPMPEVLSTISLDNDPVKGDANAPVIMVEFSDFQCPFCSSFYQNTLPLIDDNYIKTSKVKLVFRDYPLGFHQNANAAHIASECANKQGKFWQYHDELFSKQQEWQGLDINAVAEKFLAYADELDLDKSQFSSCTKDASIQQEIQFDIQEGTKYGTSGTPTFFIGNEKDGFTKLVGAQPFAAFQAVIEDHLK